jgi:hypothetical protein
LPVGGAVSAERQGPAKCRALFFFDALRCTEGAELLNALVACGLNDEMIDDAVGFVDAMKAAIPKAAHGRVIFFAGNVIVSFVEQLHCAVKAAGSVHSRIDRRMIVQIFAVIDRGPLDFLDSFVDFVDCVFFFLVHVLSRGKVFQMSAGMPQVGQGMEIRRMSTRFAGETQGGADGKKKNNQGAMSCDFHGLLASRQNELRCYQA